jgi:hypothetical protein
MSSTLHPCPTSPHPGGPRFWLRARCASSSPPIRSTADILTGIVRAGRSTGRELRSLTMPAWRRGRMMARDLAKSSFRTYHTQTHVLRVGRFGPERTQRSEALFGKTGRQAKFCRTLDQNFLDDAAVCNKIYCIAVIFATNYCIFSRAGSRPEPTAKPPRRSSCGRCARVAQPSRPI